MNITPADLPRPLPYAGQGPPLHPGLMRVFGAVSILVGFLGLGANALVAAAMFKQLTKQWSGRGASALPIEAWLTATGAGAALGAGFAAFLVVAGVMTLRRPSSGVTTHRWYARAQLPLAFAFAACFVWGVVLAGNSGPGFTAASGALVLLLGGAYPALLLYVFRPRQAELAS